MTRLAVLSNPLSRRNRGRGLARVAAAARAAGIAHHQPDTPAALDAALAECAVADTELLAINGGDGTLDRVLGRLRNGGAFAREPALAVLRGGTTNMSHGDFGFGGRDAAAALARLARETAGGIPPAWLAARAPIAVAAEPRMAGDSEPASNPAPGPAPGLAPEPFYGFFVGFGAVPRAIEVTRARLHERGLAGQLGDGLMLAWCLARTVAGRVEGHPILQPRPIRFAMTADCDAAPPPAAGWRDGAHVLIIATSLRRLLLGLDPAPAGPGAFGVAGLAGGFRRGHLLRELPGLLRGCGPARLARGGLWREPAGCLWIDGMQSYTVDGEMFTRTGGAPLALRAAAPVRLVTDKPRAGARPQGADDQGADDQGADDR